MLTKDASEAVLRFWFETHGEDDWFGAKPEFDAAIAAEFTEIHRAVARGEAWRWRNTGAGRLAEIIVIDQFSRQLSRNGPEAFATDGMALTLAQEAVAGGHHHFLEPRQRMFMLMPFMHSESGVIQSESVRLFTALGIENALEAARQHAECIRRFGRFPKRNEALGRASTAEELDYIATSTGMA